MAKKHLINDQVFFQMILSFKYYINILPLDPQPPYLGKQTNLNLENNLSMFPILSYLLFCSENGKITIYAWWRLYFDNNDSYFNSFLGCGLQLNGL